MSILANKWRCSQQYQPPFNVTLFWCKICNHLFRNGLVGLVKLLSDYIRHKTPKQWVTSSFGFIMVSTTTGTNHDAEFKEMLIFLYAGHHMQLWSLKYLLLIKSPKASIFFWESAICVGPVLEFLHSPLCTYSICISPYV